MFCEIPRDHRVTQYKSHVGTRSLDSQHGSNGDKAQHMHIIIIRHSDLTAYPSQFTVHSNQDTKFTPMSSGDDKSVPKKRKGDEDGVAASTKRLCPLEKDQLNASETKDSKASAISEYSASAATSMASANPYETRKRRRKTARAKTCYMNGRRR